MSSEQDERDLRLAELLEQSRAGSAPSGDALGEAGRDAAASLEFIHRLRSTPPADEPGEAEGRALGDFRIVRELGRGGMGVVYEAEQLSLGRRVALKVLPFAAVLDPKHLQRFRNEAQAAAQLHHTNIVPVHAVGCERGVHYYAMQYIEGESVAHAIGDLRDRRAGQTPLSSHSSNREPGYIRMAAQLGAQAADALDHAHQLGVVHRDVKPANLLVDFGGNVWVTDFGLARFDHASTLTVSGDLVGTIRYMSPEQTQAKRAPLDHRTDVYSLGATLYELLTLAPAVTSETTHEALKEIVTKNPRPPRQVNPAVPTDLETIVLKALAKEPAGRYATAQEMADDLRRFLDDKPVLARRAPLLDHAARWAKSHRAAVVAATAVLVVAVVALAVSTIRIAAEQKRTKEALEDSTRSAERATSALAESNRHSARAEANFGKAREAVDGMLSRVGNEQLAGVPGLEPVRRKLLEDAVAFYRGFLEERGGDPRVQIETARAYQRLAEIHYRLADFASAEQALDHGRTLLAESTSVETSEARRTADLLDVELLQGQVFAATGRPMEALSVYERATALAETCLREHPKDARYEARLALACRLMGRHLRDLGRFSKADESLHRALAVQESLSGSTDQDPQREHLSGVLIELADLASSMGRTAEAEEHLRHALAQADSSTSSDSGSFEQRARAHRSLGRLLQQLGRLDEAEKELRSAGEMRTQQAREHPHFPVAAIEAAECRSALGHVLALLGRRADAKVARLEARAGYEGCLDVIAAAPALRGLTASNLITFARTLVECGEPADAESACRRAVELLGELAENSPSVPVYRKDLAVALCESSDILAFRLTAKERSLLIEKSARLLGDVLAEVDEIPAYREAHATSVTEMARIFEERRKYAKSCDTYRRAVELWRDLASAPAAPESCWRRLAYALRNWADTARKAGRLDDAEQPMTEAMQLVESRYAAAPGLPANAEDLAEALNSLTRLKMSRDELAGAEAVNARALRLLEDLVVRLPRIAKYQTELVAARRNLGRIQERTGRVTEAERTFRATVAMCRDLIVTLPDADRKPLAGALWSLAAHLSATGRRQERLDAWLESLENDPTNFWVYDNAVHALSDDKDPALWDRPRAVALARQAVEHSSEKEGSHQALAIALACNEQWEEARNEFATFREIADDDGGDHAIYEALVHAHFGDLERARACYDAAMKAITAQGSDKTATFIVRRRAEVAALLGITDER